MDINKIVASLVFNTNIFVHLLLNNKTLTLYKVTTTTHEHKQTKIATITDTNNMYQIKKYELSKHLDFIVLVIQCKYIFITKQFHISKTTNIDIKDFTICGQPVKKINDTLYNVNGNMINITKLNETKTIAITSQKKMKEYYVYGNAIIINYGDEVLFYFDVNPSVQFLEIMCNCEIFSIGFDRYIAKRNNSIIYGYNNLQYVTHNITQCLTEEKISEPNETLLYFKNVTLFECKSEPVACKIIDEKNIIILNFKDNTKLCINECVIYETKDAGNICDGRIIVVDDIYCAVAIFELMVLIYRSDIGIKVIKKTIIDPFIDLKINCCIVRGDNIQIKSDYKMAEITETKYSKYIIRKMVGIEFKLSDKLQITKQNQTTNITLPETTSPLYFKIRARTCSILYHDRIMTIKYNINGNNIIQTRITDKRMLDYHNSIIVYKDEKNNNLCIAKIANSDFIYES